MKHAAPFEFAAVVTPEGSVILPAAALSQEGLKKGDRVVVRVTSTKLVSALEKHGVTEAEVDRIAAKQMEGREQALRFLLAEGALRPHGRSTARRRKK